MTAKIICDRCGRSADNIKLTMDDWRAYMTLCGPNIGFQYDLCVGCAKTIRDMVRTYIEKGVKE